MRVKANQIFNVVESSNIQSKTTEKTDMSSVDRLKSSFTSNNLKKSSTDDDDDTDNTNNLSNNKPKRAKRPKPQQLINKKKGK